MKFTNVASFAAILVASVQAAELTTPVKTENNSPAKPEINSTNKTDGLNQLPVCNPLPNNASGSTSVTKPAVSANESSPNFNASNGADVNKGDNKTATEKKSEITTGTSNTATIQASSASSNASNNSTTSPNATKNTGTAVSENNKNPENTPSSGKTDNTSAVTVNSSPEQKADKIMSMNKGTFGNLKEDDVKGFLTAEEWGRIDYHNNADTLSKDLLVELIKTPSNSLNAETKADRILALKPTPTKMGDLTAERVMGILTPEEWGRVDFHNNDDALTRELLIELIKSPSTSLTVEDKANRILALNPKPVKFGDLTSERVMGILTPEEWGRVDYHNNSEDITREKLIEIIGNKVTKTK